MLDPQSTILLCDDDRVVLATFADGLTRSGFNVIPCDSGEDAILLAREHRPDIALLDLRMQGKTGSDVAGYLREVLGIPFLFLSAFSDQESVAQAIRLGALGYLVKPLEIAQVVPELRLALERARLDKATAHAQRPSGTSEALGASPEELRGMAIGLLMERYGISVLQANRRLSSWSRKTQMSEFDAARSLVEQADALSESIAS